MAKGTYARHHTSGSQSCTTCQGEVLGKYEGFARYRGNSETTPKECPRLLHIQQSHYLATISCNIQTGMDGWRDLTRNGAL